MLLNEFLVWGARGPGTPGPGARGPGAGARGPGPGPGPGAGAPGPGPGARVRNAGPGLGGSSENKMEMHIQNYGLSSQNGCSFQLRIPRPNTRELLVSVFLRTLKRTPTFQNLLKELRRSATHAEALK